MNDLARIAYQLAELAKSCSMTTVAFQQAIEALQAQVTALEARVAGLSVGIDPGHTKPGCVCPPGAEVACMGWGCPRKNGASLDPHRP